ncbi:MAG: hypothetical protein EXS37_10605 [Opitutus sp.]|nr:hypothetical protein [Opitutus sp.]
MTPTSASGPSESAYNVLPADYGSHLPEARAHDLVLWENHGWGVRSIAGDGDTLLWVAAYQLRSRHAGPFVKPEFSALQSMVAHVEFTAGQRATMHDNDFVALGWNGLGDLRPPGDLAITVGEDQAVWAMNDMRFTAAPPDWHVRGRQRETDYDLHLHADRPAFWLTDRRITARQNGDRWHLVNARATGSVTVDGRRIALEGMGWHERHIHLNDHYDPIKLLKGPGIVFHNGYSAELDFHLMGRPQLGVFRAKILCGGEEFNFKGAAEIETPETGHWVDPRSRLHSPIRWRVRCRNASASLELDVQAFARTFYLWNFLTGGVNVLHWWLAEATGRFERPGRAPLAVARLQHVVHQNQALYHYT